MSSGSAVDYEPPESPDYAVDHSPFIVEGTLEKVLPGPAESRGDPLTDKRTAHDYVLLVIHIDRVISGTKGAVANDLLYARAMNGNATAAELTQVIPDGRVVAVVSEPTHAVPAPLHEFLVAPVQVYDPYVDGLWFQGTSDPTMFGVYVRPADLPSTWGHPTTLDDYIQRIHEAAIS